MREYPCVDRVEHELQLYRFAEEHPLLRGEYVLPAKIGRKVGLGQRALHAAAVVLLLAVNIRNAWDLMLAFARQVASKSSDT